MGDFEKEIKKQADKIIQNIDFKIEKIENYNEKAKSANVLLKDKNSDFVVWFDVWLSDYDNEITGDWNAYIFDLNNSKDLLQKYIQEDATVFENAFYAALEFENYV